MEAKTIVESNDRPLVGRLDALSHEGGFDKGHQQNGDPSDSRLVQLIGEFFRGDKEKRRRLLKAAQIEAHLAQEEVDEEADKYEPQRITRKIHWQYNRSMKKVPMLRRDYIG